MLLFWYLLNLYAKETLKICIMSIIVVFQNIVYNERNELDKHIVSVQK